MSAVGNAVPTLPVCPSPFHLRRADDTWATSTLACPVARPEVAVICADPLPVDVTIPVPPTVATEGLLVDQVTVAFGMALSR